MPGRITHFTICLKSLNWRGNANCSNIGKYEIPTSPTIKQMYISIKKTIITEGELLLSRIIDFFGITDLWTKYQRKGASRTVRAQPRNSPPRRIPSLLDIESASNELLQLLHPGPRRDVEERRRRGDPLARVLLAAVPAWEAGHGVAQGLGRLAQESQVPLQSLLVSERLNGVARGVVAATHHASKWAWWESKEESLFKFTRYAMMEIRNGMENIWMPKQSESTISSYDIDRTYRHVNLFIHRMWTQDERTHAYVHEILDLQGKSKMTSSRVVLQRYIPYFWTFQCAPDR